MAMQLKINTLVAVDFFEIIRVYLNERRDETPECRQCFALTPFSPGGAF